MNKTSNDIKELTAKLYALAGLILMLLVGTVGIASAQYRTDNLYVQNKIPEQHKKNVMVPLSKVLEKIEHVRHVTFVYQSDLIEGKKVSQKVLTSADLVRKLGKLLVNNGLTYEKQAKGTYVIKRLPMFHDMRQPAAASQITGTVTDAGTGEALPGVNILVVGTSKGTTTDTNGKYELSVEGQQDTLRFSYIGYKTREVPVNGRSTIDVVLTSATTGLEEMVVTALGFEESAREATSSSSQISSKSLEQSGAPDLLGNISGKAAGLDIAKSSGRPGSSSRILIRGQVSLQSDNQPLFVVDGVPVDNSTYGTGSAGYYQQSRINDLNSDDIQSIRVLKGPAASAIWGSRAANGVIVVTTKEGKRESNKLNLSYTSALTLTDVNRTVNNQRKFGQGSNGDYIWGSALTWGDKIADRSGGEDVRIRPDFPYSKIIQKNSKETYDHARDYLKTGSTWDNSLTLSGGDDNSTFYVGFSHKDQNGYIKRGSTFKKTSIRGNFKQYFTHDFTASLKVNYVRTNARRLPKSNATAGINIGAYRTPPDFNQHPATITYIDENGNRFPKYQRAFRNPDGSNENPGYPNPFWVMDNVYSQNVVDRIFGDTHLEYDPISWLSFSERLGLDTYADNRKNFNARRGGGNPTGGYSVIDRTNYQINSDFIIRASHQFTEDYSGSILVGWNLNQRNFDRSLSSGDDIIIRNAPPIIGNDRTFGADSYSSIERISALYSVLKFSAFHQLNLKFTGRSESASTYGANTDNTYLYPSASVAWEFTELPILKNNSLLSFGKLRASYGITGIQPDVYSTQTSYQIASTGANLGPGTQSTYFGGGTELDETKGNDKLQPELVKEYEFGIDLQFLKGRVGLSATQYFTHTDRAILRLDVAPSSGFSSRIENGAKIRNIGTELELNVSWLQSKDFNWQTTANWSTNNNEVTDLSGVTNVALKGPYDISVSNSAIKGEPFGVLYGRIFAKDDNGKYILDSNGFPQLASGFHVIGDPNPDWTMGISNTISYKAFTLGALLAIKQGGVNYNGTKGVQKYFGVQGEETWETTSKQNLVNYNGETIPQGTTFRGYVKDFGGGPVAIDQAWFVNGLGGGFSGASSQFVEDAGFVRIRNITLSYNLGTPAFKKKTGLSSIDFTFKAQDPFLWTKYTGVDPETDVSGPGNGRGLDYFNPPGTRSFIFSIKVNY